ncbi:MAG: hypothetical protein JW894_13885 [Bacteroidales bacterium]|nr:hypothetical protein [Bacteroidales bacterium]
MKFALVLLFHSISLSVIIANSTDSLFRALDKALSEQEQIDEKKEQRIQVLYSMLGETTNQETNQYIYGIYEKLFRENRSFIYDSAFKYANLLLETSYRINDKQLIEKSKVDLGFTLLSAGIFNESIDTLLSVRPDYLNSDQKVNYYFNLGRAWFDLCDYVQDQFFTKYYNQKGFDALETALEFAEEDSKERLFVLGLYNLRKENFEISDSCYNALLNHNSITNQEYAVAASSLAYLRRVLNDPDYAMELLIKAAITDIKTSTKETVAMLRLAEMIFMNGDVKSAYIYINHAVEDADFYGARQRKVQISDILPIIEARQHTIKEKQRKLLLSYSIGLTILSILLIALAITVFVQFKKLKRIKTSLDITVQNLQLVNSKLREVSTIKNEYIAHFFDVISEYIKKIERFKKSVGRKLSANLFSDISDIVQNIDLEGEREELYHSFDNIFIKLFPNFITKFNSLLREKDHFIQEEGKALSPELRIFALMRLGISDNEKIAKFLNYSVTTIYTYKTKVKKKAIVPNEKFEEKLMEIKVD